MRQRSTAASLRWDFTILVGFLVLVGLLRFAASGVVAAGLAAQTQAVNETWQANDEVLQSLTDAETGIRGYQLAGDPAFLQPYESGMRTYPASMASLRGWWPLMGNCAPATEPDLSGQGATGTPTSVAAAVDPPIYVPFRFRRRKNVGRAA